MKKVIMLLVIVCLSFVSLKANKYDLYEEKLYVIDFDGVGSKNINNLFYNLDVFMVDITISIGNFTDTYTINTYLTSDIEREITRRIIDRLNYEGKRELASTAEYKGYLITRASLLINEHTYKIIKKRASELSS